MPRTCSRNDHAKLVEWLKKKGYAVDDKLADPKFKQLVGLLVNLELNRTRFKAVMKHLGKMEHGPTKKLLPFSRADRTMYNLCGAVGGNLVTSDQRVMLFPLNNTRGRICWENPGAGAQTVELKSNSTVAIVKETELPADLRHWPPTLISGYFDALYYNVQQKGVQRPMAEKSRLFWSEDIRDRIQPIRRVNCNPSESQLAVANRQLKKPKPKERPEQAYSLPWYQE